MNRLVTIILLMLITVAIFFISACTSITTPENQTEALIKTNIAQTVEARFTQYVFETISAQLTQLATNPFASATYSQPTSPIVQPSATISYPTNTPQPSASYTNTPAPLIPTAIPIPCNRVEYVKDVTFVDGSIIAPGATFTKVWRLKNTGSCTWNAKYALVFVSGDRMQADKHIPINRDVFPGETVDLSVVLVAPIEKGRYRGYWMLSNSDGMRFGYGKKADQAFWLDIKVKPGNKSYAYDFAINVCTANWRSSAGNLTCMGESNSPNGSVILLDNPRFESGRLEDEPTLWMRPQITSGGWISGIYPAYQVMQGDHFRTAIGCLHASNGCELTFSLNYQEVGTSTVINLGNWIERYDGAITSLDVDLSSLVGKRVQFILTVTTHNNSANANAFWFVPSIRRFPPTATPTQTPTVTLTSTPTVTDTATSTLTPTLTATP